MDELQFFIPLPTFQYWGQNFINVAYLMFTIITSGEFNIFKLYSVLESYLQPVHLVLGKTYPGVS